MVEEQQTLFDWIRARRAPRGAVSRAELPADLGVTEAEVRDLHRRLETALGTVDLIVTDNRKRMVTAKRKDQRLEMRLHHMFVDCDDVALSALVGLARGDGQAKVVLRDFIRDNREVIRSRAAPEVSAAGAVHDLEAALRRTLSAFETLEDELGRAWEGCHAQSLTRPDGLEDVNIGWGRDGKGRRSIRFGSYDFAQQLIRIHPALDVEWVPEYFVDFVVYHELLHAVLPVRTDAAGRRVLHSPEFRALEQPLASGKHRQRDGFDQGL